MSIVPISVSFLSFTSSEMSSTPAVVNHSQNREKKTHYYYYFFFLRAGGTIWTLISKGIFHPIIRGQEFLNTLKRRSYFHDFLLAFCVVVDIQAQNHLLNNRGTKKKNCQHSSIKNAWPLGKSRINRTLC